MAPIAAQIMRGVFAAGERVAPRLTGRAAFELFCRTPSPGRLTAAERTALARAADFMRGGHTHRLAASSGPIAVHAFGAAGVPARGTVLAIHGWRSRTEHLRVVIEALRRAGFDVVSLDLPGHGHSAGRRLNMALAVEAVRVAADRFGPFAAIVGHSFGGAVAINAAVGSVEGQARVVTGRIVAMASPSSMPRLFAGFGQMLGLGPRTQAALDGQVQRVTGHPLGAFECGEQLRRHRLPTLVIHDADDREVSGDHARLTAGAGDHVRLHWTRGLGHRRILADAAVAAEVAGFVAPEPERPSEPCGGTERQVERPIDVSSSEKMIDKSVVKNFS